MKKATDKNALAESFVPNSIAYKNSHLEKAKEMLEIAKSIPRSVRKANPNECDFSRERDRIMNAEPRKLKEREDGMISAKDAVEFYGVSQFTVQIKRKQGLIDYKKENGKYFYNLEDLLRVALRKRNIKKDEEDQVA